MKNNVVGFMVRTMVVILLLWPCNNRPMLKKLLIDDWRKLKKLLKACGKCQVENPTVQRLESWCIRQLRVVENNIIAEIEESPTQALRYALHMNNMQKVLAALSRGADVNERIQVEDGSSRTILFDAVCMCDVEIVEKIVACKPNFEVGQTTARGENTSVLYFVLDWLLCGDKGDETKIKMMRLLLDAGANPHLGRRDQYGHPLTSVISLAEENEEKFKSKQQRNTVLTMLQQASQAIRERSLQTSVCEYNGKK